MAVDCVVVGSGPNGLAAGITFARAGLDVVLIEAAEEVGGALRSTRFETSGAVRDLGSAIHPFVAVSEFFRNWQVRDRVAYIEPEISYAHPLGDGQAGIAFRDLEATVDALGEAGKAWRRRFGTLARRAENVSDLALSPVSQVARRAGIAARLGSRTVHSLAGGAGGGLPGNVAPAMFAGVSAHAGARLPSLAAASVGLVLGSLAHADGWLVPQGGTHHLADAMRDDFVDHGGRILVGTRVRAWSELPAARTVIFAIPPADAVRIAGDRLPDSYRRSVSRRRHGNGIFKIDYLTSQAIPWKAELVRRAPTVHLGGTADEVGAAEACVARGEHPEHPFVLLAQPTVVDPTRAGSQHVTWAYCHVPYGSDVDMSRRITDRIEFFAPGFRDTIVEQKNSSSRVLESWNPSLVGGDISGGSMRGLDFVRRPTLSSHPWRTSDRNIFFCSSYTSPGPGVHGMGGYHAARDALDRIFGLPPSKLGI